MSTFFNVCAKRFAKGTRHADFKQDYVAWPINVKIPPLIVKSTLSVKPRNAVV